MECCPEPWKYQGGKEKCEGEKEDGQRREEGEEEKGRENEGNCPEENAKIMQRYFTGIVVSRSRGVLPRDLFRTPKKTWCSNRTTSLV
jgi:hypothetical protein